MNKLSIINHAVHCFINLHSQRCTMLFDLFGKKTPLNFLLFLKIKFTFIQMAK